MFTGTKRHKQVISNNNNNNFNNNLNQIRLRKAIIV